MSLVNERPRFQFKSILKSQWTDRHDEERNEHSGDFLSQGPSPVSLSESSKLSKKKAGHPLQFKFIVKYDFTDSEM